MRREFMILDGEGRNLDIVAKFDSLAGQPPRFSVTSQRGSNHAEMLACAPPEVAADIAALVAVHLCDVDGSPTHVSNATYFLERGETDHAVSALGPSATEADLVRLATKRAEFEVTRSPGLQAGMRDALVAAAKEFAKADDAATRARRDRQSFVSMNKVCGTLASFSRVASGQEPLSAQERLDRGNVDAGRKLLGGKTGGEALRIASTGLSASDHATIKARADGAVMAMALEDVLEAGGLKDRWYDAADRAREALRRPDFRIAARPDPAVDTTTFDGFAAVNGLSLEILRSRPIEDRRVQCDCRLTHAGTGETYEFDFSGPRKPDIAGVLEHFQSDCGCVIWNDLDSFLDELCYTGSAKAVRTGEKAYEGCNRQGRALLSMLGEDRMADFLSKVGDSPIHLEDGLPAGAFSADTPAPGMR